jgi:cytochrome oxidase Cu insertion factor (SCO1/SenC/PrrC family)
MRGMLFLAGVLAWAQANPAATDLNRVAVGMIAPDFELPAAAGGKLKLSSFRGKHVVLIFYRGYW